MATLSEYQKKLALLNALQGEIQEMENDPEFAKEKEFSEKLDELLEKYGKTRADLVAMLPPQEREKHTPSQGGVTPSGKPRRRQKTKVWENPHTGERVEAKSPLHKTIQGWIAEHGKEEVKRWQVREKTF